MALRAAIEELTPESPPKPSPPKKSTPKKVDKAEVARAAEAAKSIAARVAAQHAEKQAASPAAGAPPSWTTVSSSPGGSGATAGSFSAFEQQFLALWAKGKCESAAALRAHLDALPQTKEAMAAFVGDSLSEDVLAAIVRAAAVVCGGGAPDAAAAAAALLDRLRAARRFEMVWMFCEKAEQQAARAVLDAYAAAEPDASAPLVAACKKAYGLK